jgi:hypothetical protein
MFQLFFDPKAWNSIHAYDWKDGAGRDMSVGYRLKRLQPYQSQPVSVRPCIEPMCEYGYVAFTIAGRPSECHEQERVLRAYAEKHGGLWINGDYTGFHTTTDADAPGAEPDRVPGFYNTYKSGRFDLQCPTCHGYPNEREMTIAQRRSRFNLGRAMYASQALF